MESYINRFIDKELMMWKEDLYHKVLLVRGARQVGKSSSVRHFGKNFKYYIEINIQNEPVYQELFKKEKDVKQIINNISVISKTEIIPGETLLFIDEIQACPEAITSLRYFYEKCQELHVIAAGSLLEFGLKKISSFGVGRITSLYMYPLSFSEFLEATNSKIIPLIKDAGPEKPLNSAIHTLLIKYVRDFLYVGGMPEAVSTWIRTSDYLACQRIHMDILNSYIDDFTKYDTKIDSVLLRQTFLSIAQQQGSKFVFSKVTTDIRLSKIKEALDTLVLAGITIPVVHTAAQGIPLGAQINPKFTKYLFFDSGLLLVQLGLSGSHILLDDAVDLVNKGSMAELFTGLEILKYSEPHMRQSLFYWQRLKKGSEAEVDYIISRNTSIIPIEVKAGTRGSMKSLYVFLSEHPSLRGIRCSLEPFATLEKVDVYPLYAIKNIVEG